MKHPERLVLFSGGGCMLLAGILFCFGVGLEHPALKSAAKWLWLLAILIAFLPLLTLAIVVLIEKVRRK